MIEYEMKKYKALNTLADKGGIVIFGDHEDCEIPLGELKQALAWKDAIYNRSVSDLSVTNAIDYYKECITELCPDTVLLHIGAMDMALFEEAPSEFDQKYRELITYIKALDKNCEIVVVSMKNYNEMAILTEMNKHLKYIAESERCEFADISSKRVWNPKQTKEIVSFVYSIGFVQTLKNKRPIYDLVKFLFCYEA